MEEMGRPTLQNFASALSQKPTLRTLAGGFFVIFLLHWVVRLEQIMETGHYRSVYMPVSKNDLSKYPPLGLSQSEEFPGSGQIRMPKRIHQTWKSAEVPRKLINWVKSWVEKNPDWEYWLWTDDSARQLIADRHPHLLPVYNGYYEGIRRADSLRYVVLYEFGGVYADMDVECLKPIDPFVRKYACFIPQEPTIHPILDTGADYLAINALMGCRPKHPFFKTLIDNLHFYNHMWHVLDSTGPNFVTSIYKKYITNHTIPATDENGLYLAPSEYFFPTIDPAKHFWFRKQCSNFEKLTKDQQRACVGLKYRGVPSKPLPMSFTDHHWIHTYVDINLSLKGPVAVHSLIPGVKIYKGQNVK